MFSTELGYTLEAAFREASSRNHAFFCLEHLLFALLFDDEIARIIKRCGGDVGELKKDLEDFFADHVERVPATDIEHAEPVQTPAVQRVLQAAIFHMHSAGKEVITGTDVLVALFREEDSHAVYYLKKQDISRLDVLHYISHGVGKAGDDDEEDEERDLAFGEEDEITGESRKKKKREKALEKYTEELTDLAKGGELDPIIGRDEELERTVKILCRRQKNNPLFLGDPGVGKTAMAHALAHRIVSGDVPELLQDSKLFSLNIGSLIAGTKFRGEFEERLRNIVRELKKIPKSILFIDEIHTIVGAGATGTGSMDAANLLKPALGAGGFRCIGSTTYEDFKKHFEKDRALNRRFSTVELDEPTIEETIKILEGLKERFENHHEVKFSKPALRAAAELSAKHINDRQLPDKAIDVLDEAGAANLLLSAAKRKKTITDKDIERVVSAIAKVPIQSVSSSDEDVLRNLEERIKQRVFGQDPAVQAVSRAMKRARANLAAEGKPMGSFLFAGPTGVGKTELARVLSQELGVHFHRFDMSEYMEKHAVARLIGAPPGYVGYDEGGLLTDLVRKHPYAVLLLDEIEKAHEDIYNILLQVMDEASLVDNHGRKADFRHVIVIMTTNAGSGVSASIGFGKSGSDSNREKAIKKQFKPEFRNRLDEIVYFQSLPPEVIRLVVDKVVGELEIQLKARKVTLSLADEVRDWLAEKGFDEQLGARPMARLVQRELKDVLTDELLFGKLKKGGHVEVELLDDQLQFKYSKEPN